MKVAFFHIEPKPGQIEANRRLYERLIQTSAMLGARWILTPELGVSGYYFADLIGTLWIKPQPDEWMNRIKLESRRLGLVVFLSHPERDKKTDKLHNTLFAFHQGRISGRHRKIEVHPGAEEAWSSPGDSLKPVAIDGTRIGMLICADTWDTHHGLELQKKAAKLLVVSAAWGHKYPPLEHWKTLSLSTGLPVWICNRTGQERNVDWSQAESMVLVKGQPVLRYSGKPALLVFDWDFERIAPNSVEFTIIPVDGRKT
ncbi:carbon-nitrogen hydrolase family protein [Dehalogenimonas alkenigignens]|uniref:carbon-nitrogen hydrolase family protein n=1 Tax=Dehalogenimonas alkenigignens TaxID=1217799 RepID=UPI000D58905A|nr:carbon-nitrogen hydrolase family protein [Dehalogenimonas alkenigignens]PVV82626.1 carbon-nitrogen hydrolase family protein [Dehalogenimonas alkenigignens]